MATYSIQGDTLKGMADSIRAYKGEKILENPLHVEYSADDNSKPYIYHFPNAKSIKVVFQQQADVGTNTLIGIPYETLEVRKNSKDSFFNINVYSGKSYTFPYEAMAQNTDTISISIYETIRPWSFKADIYAYDENGVLLPNSYLYTATDIANELADVCSIAPKPEDLILSGDCSNSFSYNKFKWLRDKIKGTNNISSLSNMFQDSDVEAIDYSLNLAANNVSISVSGLFVNCDKLKKIPDIIGLSSTALGDTDRLFAYCSLIKEIPVSWENINYNNEGYNFSRAQMFQNCYNLRKISENLIKKLSMKKATYYFYSLSYSGFQGCYTLEEIRGFVIPNPDSTVSNNFFNNTFYSCSRLKDLIFLKEEGTRGNLQRQTIDLRDKVGYITSLTDFPISVDKSEFDLITDDESYQRFKNSENSFACSIEYSRYNHDSAVRTINSLPDLSGNTGAANTIVFKGEAGSRTDGGAINTMTEEEIAVATAKGWVVSFV